jgi:hypothetical protein
MSYHPFGRNKYDCYTAKHISSSEFQWFHAVSTYKITNNKSKLVHDIKQMDYLWFFYHVCQPSACPKDKCKMLSCLIDLVFTSCVENMSFWYLHRPKLKEIDKHDCMSISNNVPSLDMDPKLPLWQLLVSSPSFPKPLEPRSPASTIKKQLESIIQTIMKKLHLNI